MKIAEHLTRTNRWWTAGKVDAHLLPALARAELPALCAAIRRAPVLSLVGLRRMGKTTLIYGAIQRLMAEGTPPKRILYIDAEDPIASVSQPKLSEYIAAYLDEVLQEPISALNGPVYVFVDEAHRIAGWHADIKALMSYDIGIQWVVISSHKTMLYKGARLSLLGRVENMLLPPLDFQAFCRFYADRNPRVNISPYLEVLPRACALTDPLPYAAALADAMPVLEPVKQSVLRALREYMAAGAYPEFDGDAARWRRSWVQELLPHMLYHDILALGGVKNPDVLLTTLAAIAQDNGEAFSFTALANAMGVDTVTIQGYLSQLQRAGLILVQENYVEVSGRVIRKNKKLYIADSGLLCALRRLLPGEAEAELASTCVLMAARTFAERELFGLRYWRDEQREVELIIDKGGSALPIAVAYDEKASTASSLKAFCGRFSAEASLIITRDELAVTGTVVRLPLWLLRV